ncbi:hypothetical protein SAMN04488242_0740 [Tessaracoccus oleiagri]|uniref:EspG family protein n=2 Tax=Tessaracoccus oleiagri TaxID=686624 RepID=A0A1G9I5J3_9ACTN|nr:hypothetical protein SAMN04488242_0740 [Tessaracoccus oleiagri]
MTGDPQMTTMIQADDPTLHVGMIGGTVWADAVDRIHAGVVPDDDADLRALWEAAGILTREGIDPLWARAIEIAQTSTRGCEIVSRYGDVVFAATVLLANERDQATCVTSRATVATDADGREVVGAVHPMVELAIAPADRLWRLIRRVLPPLDALRHEPRVTPESEAKRVTLDGVTIPESMTATPESFALHLLDLPNLPPKILDATEPQATVFTYTLVGDGDGVRTLSRTWALGKKLYLIDAESASIWEVPPGDVGSALVRGLTD